MRRRCWVIGCVLAALLAGCDGPSMVGDSRDRTPETASYGDRAQASTPAPPDAPPDASAGATAEATATPPVPSSGPPATAAPHGQAGVELSVVDPLGTPRPGVAVRIDGTGGTFSAVSDADGKVRRGLPPGTYRATVPEGCSEQLRILRGGSAQVGVPEATTTRGQLVAEVTPRYEVAAPVGYDGDAGWRVGEVHHVRFRLVDPCRGPVPPPRRYATARFVSSPGTEVLEPLSSTVAEDGTVEVAMRCVEADVDVELAMVDALDPRRRAEILSVALMPDQRPPFCLQPR